MSEARGSYGPWSSCCDRKHQRQRQGLQDCPLLLKVNGALGWKGPTLLTLSSPPTLASGPSEICGVD